MSIRGRRLGWILGGLLGGGAISVGCWPFDFTEDPVLMGQECEDGTTDCFLGGTGGGGAADCVPGANNIDIDESCGVFVSGRLGMPNGDGSKSSPFATIGAALTGAPGKAIYVCGEILTEAVTIDSGDVTLYGALDCANGWAYDPSKKAAVASAADEVPFTVGEGAGVTVFDFLFDAADAVKDGGSSIAVVADQGAELAMERCEVRARNGQKGVTPAKATGSGTPGGDGLPGQDGCVDTIGKSGGNGGQNVCDLVSYDGGGGGTGRTTSSGDPGGGGKPTGSLGQGGVGQSGPSSSTVGGTGAAGTAGGPGDGANGTGTISRSGCHGPPGGDGKPNATPGQGGGGGGGAKVCSGGMKAGPGGGGGGAGGCPGGVGKGGGAGGSSIAILSVGASLTLSNVTLITGKGGVGGTGGDGQSGGKGGKPGLAGNENGDGIAAASNGGPGGKGGDGGPGGGGLGGHSLGIAYNGAPPVQTEMQFTLGSEGTGGDPGNGNMTPAAHGAPGFKCKALSFNEGAPSCTN